MSDDAREGVVLLHGIRRTHRSMRKLARACQAAGFATLNIDYPSSKGNIEDHAMQIAPAIITFATRFERVHLVGFSKRLRTDEAVMVTACGRWSGGR